MYVTDKKLSKRKRCSKNKDGACLEATYNHEVLMAGVVGHGDDSEWNSSSAQPLCVETKRGEI